MQEAAIDVSLSLSKGSRANDTPASPQTPQAPRTCRTRLTSFCPSCRSREGCPPQSLCLVPHSMGQPSLRAAACSAGSSSVEAKHPQSRCWRMSAAFSAQDLTEPLLNSLEAFRGSISPEEMIKHPSAASASFCADGQDPTTP